MNTPAAKTQEKKSQAVANELSQKEHGEPAFQFADYRQETIAQRKLQEMANSYSAQQQHPIQKKENKTGLSDNLKSGVENLSGYSMDDVKVHFNSDKPGQLQAHAYAMGTDIYLAPGQEKHLPHEAWHVVQQKQGRVQPTTQMKGFAVNGDKSLESEADIMGAKALRSAGNPGQAQFNLPQFKNREKSAQLMPVVQMVVTGLVEVAVTAKTQAKTNTCWAASGWVIDLFKGGTYASEQAFVTAKGDATARTNYTNNTVTDIDRIIGSSSVTNRLSSSDTSGSFSKSTISHELASKPILANVNNNHYIVICGKRFDDNAYQLKYMDPADGSTKWGATATTGNDNNKIDSVGAYTLSVLYYIN